MSIIRVGTNKKYSEGWEAAFGGKKAAKPGAAKANGARPAAAKAKKAGAKKAKR